MDSTFGKLDGLSGIADDTFIYDKSEAEHDQHILDILDTARENNVRFNPDNFQFKVEVTSFFTFTWTPIGIKSDDHKIRTIRAMSQPKNMAELQFFMAMINYLNRFSPILTQTSLALRQLTKKHVPFTWQPEQQEAFQSVTEVVTEAPILTYYDAEKKNLIQSDASMKGVEWVLIQEGRPVCYASRSLTETESRYSNIERKSYSLLVGLWRNSTITSLARR